MKKERTLLFIGIWVILLPHLGFPELWRKILFLLTGLFIIFISYVMYRRIRKEQMRVYKNDTMTPFTENIPKEEYENTNDYQDQNIDVE